MQRTTSYYMAALAVAVMIFAASAVEAVSPPEAGGAFPDIRFPVPADEGHRRYLGLPDSVDFTIPQIKANLVVIEVFNMY